MPEPQAFKPGDVFRNQLEIVRMLGEGLHGEVYLAEHRHTHERMALKVLHLEDRKDAGKVRRSLTTAKAAFRIQHANVVRVHDLGCEEDGTVWVLMELLEGLSLGELLARQAGAISIALAFHVSIEAAWGLDAAHDLQIIHRDVKPDNIWLTSAGVVKVLDFSLAKVIPDGVQTTQKTTGFGTAPYMAPESFRGAVPDARLDVYGLGMVLRQMLGGRHPFADALRDAQEMARRQLFVEPESLSRAAGLPAYVDDLMRKALAKDPAQRFFTVAEMAQEMMTVRDRLRDDAGRGLVIAKRVPGEPPIAGAPWARHAYQAPHAVPVGDAPPEVPPQRVIVQSHESAPQDLIPARPKDTLPLGASALVRPIEALPRPSSPGPGAGREIAPAVERSAGTPRPRAWLLALPVVAALIAGVAVVSLRRRPPPSGGATLPAETASASASPIEAPPPPAETLPAEASPADTTVALPAKTAGAPPVKATPTTTATAPRPLRPPRRPGLYDITPPAAPVTAPTTTMPHRIFGSEK